MLHGIEEKLNTGKAIVPEQLCRLLEPYPCVSFDLFDTLLKRDVAAPTDVFALMEQKSGNRYPDFAAKRIGAERRAEEAFGGEPTLEEIYRCYPDLDASGAADLMQYELDTERSLITSSQELLDVYEWCRRVGKRIFLITDTYFPGAFLRGVLKELGICGYEALYVSCECRCGKRNGALFQRVLSGQELRREELVHVGDSFRADWLAPLALRIRAIHVPRTALRCTLARNAREGSTLEERTLRTFVNGHLPEGRDDWYHVGYELFGGFLWGYTHWLAQQAKRDGVSRLFFLSRDGFLMKRAFELCCGDAGIETVYLEVSRRSLRVPTLWMNCDYDTLLDMLTPSKRVSIRSFFDGAGLDIERCQSCLQQYGFQTETFFDRREIGSNPQLRALFEELKPEILCNSKREYQLLQRYLLQEQVSGRFGIVDIGWSGSMQRFLTQTLDRMEVPHQIVGYYIGVADYYTRNERYQPALELRGYLFDFKHDPAAVDPRSCFVGLLEAFFLEQDGTVCRYEADPAEGRMKAVRAPYEYRINGKNTEEQLHMEAVQQGALALCSALEKSGALSAERFSAQELFEGLRRFCAKPDAQALRLFGDFRFLDEGETRRLAAPQSLSAYIRHPGELRDDFLASRWKTGFLRRFFRLPLSYEKIYQLLRRFK